METRQIHVRDLSTVTGIQQYEHCVQSIFFLGLEDFEGSIYLSIESDKFSENVALTNNTFIIGQPMTKFNVTYTCQIYGIVGTGEKIQLSKQFRMMIDKSNTISGEAGEYPIDPNIINGIDQYITTQVSIAEADIASYGQQTIDSIPSDYTGLAEEVSDLTSFVKKDDSVDKTTTLTVASGQFKSSTQIMTVAIPANQSYQITITVSATLAGNITVYAHYSDGTYRAKSYNFTNGSTQTWTDTKDIVLFKAYANGGATSAGDVVTNVTFERMSDDSLEERVENLENASDDVVTDAQMQYTTLKQVPDSANRLDESALVTGKQVNYYSGAITDSATKAIAYIDVQPEDVIYIWRYHNSTISSGNVNGIATYDSTDTFVRQGISGDQHTFTVPSGIYKLGMNVYYNQIQTGDHYMILINDSTQPTSYEPYQEAYEAYEADNVFLEAVDFNKLIPTALKNCEQGFIESYGHMGLSYYYPCNTHWSIIGAKKAGLCGVEMDLQITSDGVIVLYHDEDLRRVGGTSSQTIANSTMAQLANYDFGAWFSPAFAGTPICTFDKATQLCRELGLKMYLDCKKVTSVANIQLAESILEKWGMEDNAIWIMGSFTNIWTALPNAKVMFPAGSKLTGSNWTDPTLGWFKSFNGNFPEYKKAFIDGMPVVPEGVWFGVTQDYSLMNASDYSINDLYNESELARERNIHYGFYAVDDVNIIAQLSEAVPYQQYMASNRISYQNAMNEFYEITQADYQEE